MTIDYLGICFAVIIAVGGIVGYVKAGSTYSLISGVIFGALIGLGAFLVSRNPRHFYLSLAVSVLLSGLMGWRFYAGGWKFMPAGLVFILSLGMTVYYGVNAYLTLSR